MNLHIQKPTPSTIQAILQNEVDASETITTELAGFLESQQIGLSNGTSQPCFAGKDGKFIISSSVLLDMATLAAFEKKTSEELQEMFLEMIGMLKIEHVSQGLGKLYNDPVPYQIQ